MVSKLSLLLPAVALLAVGFGHIAGLAAEADKGSRQKVPAPASSSAPISETGAPPPYAGSRYAGDIDQALSFLVKGDKPHDWVSLAVLNFLQRKFRLATCYGIRQTDSLPEAQRVRTDIYIKFGRLANPNYKGIAGPQHPAFLHDTNYLLHHALYCDQIAPPDDYLRSLREMHENCREQGGKCDYIITHVAIALMWLRENNCGPLTDAVKELEAPLVGELVDIVRRNGPNCDVSFESMAMLYYMGHGNRIDRAWLDAVAKAQQPDGGWALDAAGVPEDHPTVLALWTLLEASLPDVPKVSWIQHPEDPTTVRDNETGH